MSSYISEIESRFKSGDLSVRNYSVESIKDLTAHEAIMDSIYNQDQATISAMYGENIDKMPMSEIEKMHEGELKKLKSGGKNVLNMALNDLDEGNIDRQEYLKILKGLKEFEENVNKGEIDADIPVDLVNYIEGNRGSIANDMADTMGQVTKHGLTVGSLIQAYDLHKQGFEIKKYETKGGKIRYRVFNPEAIGISKPTKRSTKIYDKRHVDLQVSRGRHGHNIPIADKVNIKAGGIGGLKTKAGWAGVLIDTGLNVKDNIVEGESVSKIVGDAGVDVGIGAVSLAAAGATTAAVVGIAGAPVIIGAIAGVAASAAVSAIAGWEIGNKTVSDHIKSGVQSGIKTIAGWFSK